MSDVHREQAEFAGRSGIKVLEHVPDGLDEIIRYYGNPARDGGEEDAAFVRANIITRPLPMPLPLSWAPDQFAHNVRAHTLVIESLLDALQEIVDYRGRRYLIENEFDRFAGVMSFRRKTSNSDELSTHAWGIAIDLNPHLDEQPDFIVEAFEKRRWIWGGRWQRPSTIHFQAAKGY